jgi:hypothetical protein
LQTLWQAGNTAKADEVPRWTGHTPAISRALREEREGSGGIFVALQKKCLHFRQEPINYELLRRTIEMEKARQRIFQLFFQPFLLHLTCNPNPGATP